MNLMIAMMTEDACKWFDNSINSGNQLSTDFVANVYKKGIKNNDKWKLQYHCQLERQLLPLFHWQLFPFPIYHLKTVMISTLAANKTTEGQKGISTWIPK